MKRIREFMLASLLVLLMVSCAENPGTTTMRLRLSSTSADVGRTIQPSDTTLMEISKYTITGQGPNGKVFTRNTDSSSVEIEGLTVGDWTVTAKGLNREGTELVSGSSTFKLTATAAPQTIVLDTLVGTGSFRMVFDWSLCDVTSPNMLVYLSGGDIDSDEVRLDVTLNTDAKTATVSETLVAGSYKVRAILKDGSQQVAGLVEAIRISNGASTSGTHVFHFNELGPTTQIYLRDATGTPIKGSLTVQNTPETFLDGQTYTYVFSFAEPEKVETDGLTIDWYYDGNLEDSQASLGRDGSSFSKQVMTGVHRVDAVVYNRLVGSTGSVAYTFTALPDGEVGEMSLLNEDAALSIPGFNSNAMVSALPDDMFLVVVPDLAKMYVCSVTSRALQIVKTYDSTNFPWLNNTKHVFSDPEMDVVIATDNMNGRESFTCLLYNESAKTIEQAVGMRFEGSVPAFGLPFTNFTAASFNPFKGVITLSDAGTLGYDYRILVSGNDVSVGGTTKKKSSTYYNVVDMDVSYDGNHAVSASALSARFVSATLTENGSYVNTAESDSGSSSPVGIRFVNSQTVVTATASEIASYKVVSDSSYTRFRSIGIGAVDIEADGLNYFYVADDSNRVVSFEVTGNEIRQLGATTLGSSIRSLCLGQRYLVAVLGDSSLALFEVIE